MSDSPAMVGYDGAAFRVFITRALAALGLPPADARILADLIVGRA